MEAVKHALFWITGRVFTYALCALDGAQNSGIRANPSDLGLRANPSDLVTCMACVRKLGSAEAPR